MAIKVRLTANTEQEAQTVREQLETLVQGLKFQAPRQGTNPKYEGNQKWFCYGEWEVTPAPKVGRHKRLTPPKQLL